MVMQIDLSGRVALVTGASRNIGRAIALALAGAGAGVIVGYGSDAAGAAETCRLAAELGGKAVAAAIPLEEPDRFEAVVRDAVEVTGPVDVLVNNAAIRPRGAVSAVTPAEWDEVFALNTRAPFFLARTVLPGMVERGFGRVICLGGVSAYIGQFDRAAVIASKLAVVGVARALAFETARTGVTVNVVVPGTIDTERGDAARYGPAHTEGARESNIPMGRLGLPEEVADLCVFLASSHAAYTTGQEIFVTGGSFPITSRGVG